MSTTFPLQRALDAVRHETGIVIPIYLPPGVDARCGEALLRDTVGAYSAQVADPTAICLSIDGEPFGSGIAGELAREFGTSLHVSTTNRGKLEAVTHGARLLLRRADLAYVAFVDQDGDHLANELPNFVRTAQHIASHAGDDPILVLGQRRSLHRPMGFLRGELEAFADRILLDALSYRAAVIGRPLRLEYALAMDEFPDFHSGYKLFSRSAAEHVFLGAPQLAGVSEDGYYRHACEAVMVVEALERGAYLGIVNRRTMNEQPISTFGLLNLSQLVADQIVWPCKRLNVPLPFARQWMANHAPRLLLNTLVPQGQQELERIRRLVIAAWGDEQGDAGPTLRPLFI